MSNQSFASLFNEYNESKNNRNSLELAEKRGLLIAKLVVEERNILDNQNYVSLIADEERTVRATKYDSSKSSQLVGLTRIFLMSKGLMSPDFSGAERNIRKEYKNVFSKYHLYVPLWILYLTGGNQIDQYFIDEVINYSFKNIEDSMEIKQSFYFRNEWWPEVNVKMTTLVSDIAPVLDDLQKRQEMLELCMALYLMNTALGYKSESEYFLMKVNMLNFLENPHHLLILFLNNVVLNS